MPDVVGSFGRLVVAGMGVFFLHQHLCAVHALARCMRSHTCRQCSMVVQIYSGLIGVVRTVNITRGQQRVLEETGENL